MEFVVPACCLWKTSMLCSKYWSTLAICHVNFILREIILKSVGCHKYFFVLENIGMMAVDLVFWICKKRKPAFNGSYFAPSKQIIAFCVTWLWHTVISNFFSAWVWVWVSIVSLVGLQVLCGQCKEYTFFPKLVLKISGWLVLHV